MVVGYLKIHGPLSRMPGDPKPWTLMNPETPISLNYGIDLNIILGFLLYFKVFSFIKGYWSFWEGCLECVYYKACSSLRTGCNL